VPVPPDLSLVEVAQNVLGPEADVAFELVVADLVLDGVDLASRHSQHATGARHLGKNAYTTVIANPLFASFTTTASKSRVNFLKLLAAPHEEYVWNEDALNYAASQGLSLELRARLAGVVRQGGRIVSDDQAWQRQLAAWKVRSDEARRIVTEAALYGTLMQHEMYVGQPLISDNAGQFKISGLLHALCWLHAERSIRKLVPLSPREQEAVDGVRDAVWKYYQRLRAYRESPSPRRKAALERDFEQMFRRRTGFADLNEALRRIHEKRADLLLVLERPEIPLHNNLSEGDIREWAKRRKINAGTRSEWGRTLPRHVCQPEEDLPEAGRVLLAVPSGSHARSA